MEAEVYPEKRVEKLINDNFVPARFHIKEQPDAFKRFGAQWTPTIVVDDSEGNERHRIEGFLPADDFLAQLELGLGHTAFKTDRFDEAEKWFRRLTDELPNSDAAPEAQYWAGVSRYKASGNGDALKETAAAFKNRYGDSTWAKKASIWG